MTRGLAGRRLRLEAAAAAERVETVRGSRPGCSQRLDPDPPDDTAQDRDDHDGVDGVTHNGDKVRDQVVSQGAQT